MLSAKLCSCSSAKSNSVSSAVALKVSSFYLQTCDFDNCYFSFINTKSYIFFQNLLPDSYEYNLCDYQAKDNGFICRFRINIKMKEDA